MSDLFGRGVEFDVPNFGPDAYTPGSEWDALLSKYREPSELPLTGGTAMNGGARPLPTGWDPAGSGISWLPAVGQAIGAGVGVYNAIWGGEESGKGETVAETSTAEWYTDMPYSSVPTQRQLGMHGHPHPRGLVHRRRRRRKLLTASDKADIAFITGTLGKGEMGRTAIAALLSRRMS